MRFLITQLNGDREKFRLRYWLANIHISSHLIRNHFCSWSFYVPRSLSIFTARASCYTISAAVYYTFLEHDQNSLSHSTDHRRTKLQRKWGRKQLLPENNKRSVCCQVNRSPLPTTKKRGNFPSPSQPIQKLQTLPLYCQLHLKPLRSLDHLPTVSISVTNASIQHTMNNYLWYYWSASAVLYFPR